ncbi:fimbrial protein [Superficieibacter electus]|uniref:fimbrial protein n=1 Tax=Superficieibacter electus TaxID=2022662 RepID=UPI001FE5881B|nr:fimbrial protein [Superficieibacter electus]
MSIIIPLNDVTVNGEYNKAGTEITNITTLTSGGNYEIICKCLDRYSATFSNVYYTARVPSLPVDTTKGDRTYYTLNENLSIATEIYIHNRGFSPVPFEGVRNDAERSGFCYTDLTPHSGNPALLETGSQIKVNFLINKPFIGKVIIPSVIVADLYGGIDDASSKISSDILAEVKISGSIVVPQTCEIAAGQNLVVNLGKIPTTKFSATKGEIVPDNKITKTIQVRCTGMEDEDIVYSTFRAEPVDADGTMMKVQGNEDVGIAIFDKWNKRVNVNGGAMDMDIGQNVRGAENNSLTFSAAPASATGATPQPGTFTADATITLEIKN